MRFSIRFGVGSKCGESKGYFVYGVVARVLVFFGVSLGFGRAARFRGFVPHFALGVDQGLLRMRTQCVFLFCFPLHCILSCGVVDMDGFV